MKDRVACTSSEEEDNLLCHRLPSKTHQSSKMGAELSVVHLVEVLGGGYLLPLHVQMHANA